MPPSTWLAGWTARLKKGDLSAAELSRRSGLSEQMISQLRKGHVKGQSWETLALLAQGLHMRRAELVAAVDGVPPPDLPEYTEAAIQHDPELLSPQKETLLRVYWGFRRPTGRRAQQPPPYAS